MALLYAALLGVLHSQGVFRTRVPGEFAGLARAGAVAVEGRVESGFSPKRNGDRYWIRLDRAAGRPCTPVLAMAYLSRGDPDVRRLRPGMRVRLLGSLRLPIWPRNPGAFDERAFLDQRGAGLVFHGRQVDLLEAGIPIHWLPWAWGESVHRSLHAYLTGRFEPEDAAVLEGMAIGFKGRLSKDLSSAIQDAGVMHLLTPSGAKVTLVVGWGLLAGLALGLSPRPRLAFAMICATLYIFVVGPEPPYTRAYLMCAAMLAFKASERRSGGAQALALSAMVTLAVDPRAIASAGFQLTYLAMAGILLTLPHWVPPRAWPGPARAMTRVLAISLSVQLMLWPTFAAFFGRGSLAGLAVNMVLVPASGPISGAAFAAWALSFGPFSLLEGAAAAAARWAAGAFNMVCVRSAALPWAAVSMRPFTAGETAAYYLGVFALMAFPRRRLCLSLCAGAMLAWALALSAARGRSGTLRMVFLSQRNGRCVLVSLPGRKHWMLDAGVTASVLGPALRRLGIRRLEGVWISGWNRRRWKGLEKLPGLVELREVRFPRGWSSEKRFSRAVRALQTRRVSLGRLDPGFHAGSGGVEMRAGTPDEEGLTIGIRGNGIAALLRDQETELAGGAEKHYCIMIVPSKNARQRCLEKLRRRTGRKARSYVLPWDGAVQVVSNGEESEVWAHKERYGLRRPLP